MKFCAARLPRAGLLLLSGLLLAGCPGERPAVSPRDGVNLAPLSRPGILPRHEQRSPVAAHGQPNRTLALEIQLPDERVEGPGPAETVVTQLPPGVTEEQVEAGRQVYASAGVCAACHGADAGGSVIGPNLRDGSWLHGDGSLDAIAEVITSGVMQPVQYPGVMPPLGGAQLTSEQVRQIATYLYAINYR
jgi:mono/diheme cytochrome c family protein